MSGWTVQGIDHGETWQASFDQPGRIMRDDFHDHGYRWLTVRLTEGPKGSGKTIAVNGRVIGGRFVRTGPPSSEKKEWWVTRSYPIPPHLLPVSGRLRDPLHRTRDRDFGSGAFAQAPLGDGAVSGFHTAVTIAFPSPFRSWQNSHEFCYEGNEW